MNTDLVLNFNIGHESEDNLNLDIKVDGKSIKNYTNISQNTVSVQCQIDLPCMIEMVVSGRRPEHTVVDASGQIISDKFVEFVSLSAEGMEIQAYNIPNSHLSFQTDEGLGHKTFYSRNGTATLVIDQDDFLFWTLDHQSLILTANKIQNS